MTEVYSKHSVTADAASQSGQTQLLQQALNVHALHLSKPSAVVHCIAYIPGTYTVLDGMSY
jgi:hypothetical protein